MTIKVTLRNVRLSYAHIWEPQETTKDDGTTGKPAFSANLILDRNAPEVAEIRKAMQEAANERWKERGPAVLKGLIANQKICLRDGTAKMGRNGNIASGYENKWFVSARSYTKPTIVDRDRRGLTEADGRPYSGCIVNAVIDVWAQDNKNGRRINAGLGGLQFVADGERFGGSAPASPDEFDNLGNADGLDPFADAYEEYSAEDPFA